VTSSASDPRLKHPSGKPALQPIGEDLKEGGLATQYIPSSRRLSGTCVSSRRWDRSAVSTPQAAVEEERAYQKAMLEGFADMAGSRVCFQTAHPCSGLTLRQRLSAPNAPHAPAISRWPRTEVPVPFPYPAPVGTAGLRRMLHRWGSCIRR